MKNSYLLPGLALLAGMIGFALFPHASTYSIPGVLSGVGVIWLLYTWSNRRTKR
jgi:hypothetical protein